MQYGDFVRCLQEEPDAALGSFSSREAGTQAKILALRTANLVCRVACCSSPESGVLSSIQAFTACDAEAPVWDDSAVEQETCLVSWRSPGASKRRGVQANKEFRDNLHFRSFKKLRDE